MSVLHEKFVEAVSNIVNYEPVCSLFIGNIIEDDPEIPETSGTYIGNFKNGYRDGTGTLITPENDKYIGEWELGKRIGKEICNYSDVSVYNGE